ncbi:hypothetical protein BKA93DRAFT_765107 [Sparassis latifolia]
MRGSFTKIHHITHIQTTAILRGSDINAGSQRSGRNLWYRKNYGNLEERAGILCRLTIPYRVGITRELTTSAVLMYNISRFTERGK